MKIRERLVTRFFSILAIAFFVVLGARGPAAAGVCTDGVGVPPFLAQGEDPNVLLIIDNSASMYDLAYVPEAAAQQGDCYDGSFDSSKTYIGYFEHDYDSATEVYTPRWYSYDLANTKYVQVADQAAMTTACDAAAGTKYSNNQVCVKIDPAAAVGSKLKFFGANSNFMNWAAASKFDVEKRF